MLSATKDAERLERFEREARAASALNHPNIITIHEIAEAGSLHFIATEFIEGETLRSHLSHTRPGTSETLHIIIQIVDALAAAHKSGIIHRDIKPENIILRPDGEQIVFAGLRNDYWNLYWVSSDGRTQKQLTNYSKPNAFVRYPTWSPLGNQIIYEYAEITANIRVIDLK